MPNPLENKLLLQYLSGAGAAIAGEGSFAGSINKINQQNIATQNYMKMIQQLLGGGAKVNMDKDNVSIKAPTALLGGTGGMSSLLSGGDMQQGRLLDMLGGTNPLVSGGTPTSNVPKLSSTVNPSSSPLDISGADLAGLTPQNISQALQLKLGKEEIERKTVADISDAIYKRDVLAQRELTPKMRNYKAYVQQETAAGRPTKSMEKWGAGLLKEKRLYEEAILPAEREEYPFQDWLYDYKKLGGVQVNLGDVRAKAETTADVKLMNEIKSPKFRIKIEKIVDDSRRSNYETADDPLKARKKLIWEEMNGKIMGIPGMTFGRDRSTSVVGWYNENGELIVRWQ